MAKPHTTVNILALNASPQVSSRLSGRSSSRSSDLLSGLLIETVAHGGSVSFMHPLGLATAKAFWDESLAAAQRGKRVVLGAWDGDVLAGTVTLLLDCPPNQPHRAEIAKIMTRLSHRGCGRATALMHAAEALAAQRGVSCWCWTRRPKAAHPACTKALATPTPARFPTTRSNRMAV